MNVTEQILIEKRIVTFTESGAVLVVTILYSKLGRLKVCYHITVNNSTSQKLLHANLL
jgi:hypothetical protein